MEEDKPKRKITRRSKRQGSDPDQDAIVGVGAVPQESERQMRQNNNRREPAADQKSKRSGTSRSGKASVKETATDKTTPLKIGDIPLVSSQKWYITLSAAIGIAGSIVSGTYFVVDYGRIKPLEKELEDNKALLASAKSDAISAKSQLDRAERNSSEVAKTLDRPVPVFPGDRASVIGSSLSFIWEYGKHDSDTRYILAVQDLKSSAPETKVNVDRPETKSMFYAFDPASAGTYVWRVRRGRVVSDEEIGQGPWSAAAVFTIYPSVAQRIKATDKLLVASTPTSYDFGINNKEGYSGFEIKVARWIIPRLGEKLGLKKSLSLQVSEIAWNGLFEYMQNGEADVAIRSITRSTSRERQYPNLRFTNGYAANHQLFIQLKRDGTFPDALKGSRVGVKSRSLNESAAKFLAQRFGYEVNASYTSYGDLLEGLRRGEVAYALVDSALVSGLLDKSVFPLGGYRDDDLREFYKRELGLDHEEYAILVHEGASSALRDALNEILASEEYRKFASDAKIDLPTKH